MNKRDLPSILWLFATGVFLYLGLTENRTYMVLGVVFLVLAIVSLRRRRTS